MITEKFSELLSQFLPLEITRISFVDPTLSFGGDNWGLTTTSPWRVTNDSKMLVGGEDLLASDGIKDLLHKKIVACRIQPEKPHIDPIFILDNGMKIEVFSATYLEPWTFRFPDESLPLLVASPSA